MRTRIHPLPRLQVSEEPDAGGGGAERDPERGPARLSAGFEISAFNFLFGNTSVGNRVTTVSIYSMTNGIMTLAGSLAAGMLVSRAGTWPGVPAATAGIAERFTLIPDRFPWSPYIVIFLVSGIMRLSLTVVFSRFLKETRPVRRTRAYHLPLRILSMMPTRGIVARISILARIAWRKRTVKSVQVEAAGDESDGKSDPGNVRRAPRLRSGQAPRQARDKPRRSEPDKRGY